MMDTFKTYTCEVCEEEFIIRNPPANKELWSCPWCCTTGVWLPDDTMDTEWPDAVETPGLE